MNAISFSLFGSNPRYCVGAIRNAELVRTIYPGWEGIFFVDGSVPEHVRQALLDKGADVRFPNLGIHNGMFWRFLINDDPKVDRYIIRDADSRLNLRERTAVDAWIQSGRRFHTCAITAGYSRGMSQHQVEGNSESSLLDFGFTDSLFDLRSTFGCASSATCFCSQESRIYESDRNKDSNGERTTERRFWVPSYVNSESGYGECRAIARWRSGKLGASLH